MNVVEPLSVLGSPEHKDAPGVRVKDGGVADPGLRSGTLRQSLRRNPGEVLCRHRNKAGKKPGRSGGGARHSLTCAQLPNGVFAELHPGSLTADQDGCLSVDGTQSLTPAAGGAKQRRCRDFKERFEGIRITFLLFHT